MGMAFLYTLMITSFAGSIFFLLIGLFTFKGFQHFEMIEQTMKEIKPFHSARTMLATEFLVSSFINLLIAILVMFLINKNKLKEQMSNNLSAINPSDDKNIQTVAQTINSVNDASFGSDNNNNNNIISESLPSETNNLISETPANDTPLITSEQN